MWLDLSPHVSESRSALHDLRIAHKHRLVDRGGNGVADHDAHTTGVLDLGLVTDQGLDRSKQLGGLPLQGLSSPLPAIPCTGSGGIGLAPPSFPVQK